MINWIQTFSLNCHFSHYSVVRSPANTIDQLPDELGESQYLALSSTLMALPECKQTLFKIYFDKDLQ